jgi:hypothetical protein
MQFKNFKNILCAVRGIPQSRTTVTRAIDLALEYEANLTFAHVNNADFLISAGPTLTSLPKVKKQIQRLSEFTMTVLCDRAERRGVKKVDYVLREGQFLNQLYELLSELIPDVFVIGRPITVESDLPNLKLSDIDEFITKVEEDLKITIIPVEIDGTKQS